MTEADPGRSPLHGSADGDGRVAIFAPNPLLAITIEVRGTSGDDIHVHAGGQGVWVARMAGELGGTPVLCGLSGGETGSVLSGLLDAMPGERRLLRSAGGSGCYIIDRRAGDRRLVAGAWAQPPSRHELDDLFSTTCAAALECDVLVACNPFPAESIPPELYADLVADVRANGTPVLVDLSTPRLDHALRGAPALAKLNDWELAEYVRGPVGEPEQLEAAALRLREAGAGSVLVTRGGEPAVAFVDGETWELAPPRFERGSREGCGDSMMGAIAAALAQGRDWKDAFVLGAAAGATNFLRHGLGTGARPVVEELVDEVRLRPIGAS